MLLFLENINLKKRKITIIMLMPSKLLTFQKTNIKMQKNLLKNKKKDLATKMRAKKSRLVKTEQSEE